MAAVTARPGGRDRIAFSALAAITILGLALRLWGITWSLPDTRHPITTYHPDELVNLQAALEPDFAHGKFDIGFYSYGAFYFYLVNLAQTIGHGYHMIPTAVIDETVSRPPAENYRLLAPERAGEFLAGRIVTALMGTLTIPVLFALGTRLYGRRSGLLAGLFYAVAPLAVLHAHFLSVDVPATLFVTLALLWSAKLLSGLSWRNAAVAGVWCGLAAATKYTAGLAIVAPLTAIVLAAVRGRQHIPASPVDEAAETSNSPTPSPEHTVNAAEATSNHKSHPADPKNVAFSALIVVAVTIAVFLIACPGPWLNWHAFWDGTYDGSGVRYELFEHSRAGHGHLFDDTGPGWWYHLSVSLKYGLGIPLLALSLIGIGISIKRREPSDLLLLLFTAAVYGATCFSAVRFARYLIPLYPALSLFAARAVFLPAASAVMQRIMLAAGAIAAGFSLLYSGSLSRAMSLPDPRDRAADYLIRNATSDTPISFAHIPWFYSPPLSPMWGVLRPEIRANAPPDPPTLQLRVPSADWDESVLLPAPSLLVVANLELGPEWKRLKLPAAVRFMKEVQQNYDVTAFQPAEIPGLSPDDPNAPQDLLYVLPVEYVYRRR